MLEAFTPSQLGPFRRRREGLGCTGRAPATLDIGAQHLAEALDDFRLGGGEILLLRRIDGQMVQLK